MNKNTIKRVLLLALSLLMVVGVLASCNREPKADYTYETSYVSAEAYFAAVIPQNAEMREKFTAAYRGYNMSAEGFDDSAVVMGEVKPTDLEAAKAALEPIAKALAEAEDETSLKKFNEARNSLTAEQVATIVTAMGEKVDLESSGGPLVWVGKFLRLITHVTFDNYVLALFVFAVIVELLLLYFSIRQQKNSINQARLSPKERAIRKRYAGRNDQATQQKMQQEIQKLYQEEGFNPMSGCLPMLIQLPIVIILYNVVIDPLRYMLGLAQGLSGALSTYVTTARAAGGLGKALTATSGRGTIELLSKLSDGDLAHFANFNYYSNASACAAEIDGAMEALPSFRLFGLDMGTTPSITEPSWLWLVPILTFAVYFASMKLTRKLSYQPAAQDPQMGCSNNMMDITMPLMSVYITFITPAAIGVYWIFKSIIGVVKQFVLHKAMPLPKFTEEDYKKAERELKGKALPEDRDPRPGTGNGPKRSLHHIDDEDDLPPRVRAARSDEEEEDTPSEKRLKEQRRAEAEKLAAQAKLNGAPLKDDRKNNKKK